MGKFTSKEEEHDLPFMPNNKLNRQITIDYHVHFSYLKYLASQW